MLSRAVASLRAGKEPDLELSLQRGVEIELHLPALIPDTYLGDVPARLTLYKRIATAANSSALRELQVEMIDRFGLLPDAIKNLFAVAELRLMADRLGIARLDLGPQGGRLEFKADTRADPSVVIKLLGEKPQDFRMDGPQKLRILVHEEGQQERLAFAHKLLQSLESGA
jgi:transcription-repair coupling factor (superfamily II helicase)